MNYYNEIDPQCAQWLRNLISAGLIPPGDVDERSIEDVVPNELRGYTQQHFFAGIGGWSLALDLAGWPRDVPVITGSCPCQPFSTAGKSAGFADQRHLWPAFFHIIRELNPATVFGEQVASPDGLMWLDLVQDDLEASGYSVGAADLCAASVGAPHQRQRLYFVADSVRARRPKGRAFAGVGQVAGSSRLSGVANADMPITDGGRASGREQSLCDERNQSLGMGDSDNEGLEGRRLSAERARKLIAGAPSLGGQWAGADWIKCRDERRGFVWRPVEPGTFPLAHGVPARMDKLRGYGNAIVPQVAAAFISAYMSAEQQMVVANAA